MITELTGDALPAMQPAVDTPVGAPVDFLHCGGGVLGPGHDLPVPGQPTRPGSCYTAAHKRYVS
jgi:hypothetical protein